jgi:hypothetical protein
MRNSAGDRASLPSLSSFRSWSECHFIAKYARQSTENLRIKNMTGTYSISIPDADKQKTILTE